MGIFVSDLHAAVAQVAPVVGVAVDDPKNRSTWRIDFAEGVTGEERSAAEEILLSFVQPAPPLFPNLEPDQFWFVVRASGFEPDLKAWVASLQDTDPVSWAAASAKLEFAKFFERDHPFVEAARQAIGMSEAELDALWSYATQ